jgi:hypothetical protein
MIEKKPMIHGIAMRKGFTSKRDQNVLAWRDILSHGLKARSPAAKVVKMASFIWSIWMAE